MFLLSPPALSKTKWPKLQGKPIPTSLLIFKNGYINRDGKETVEMKVTKEVEDLQEQEASDIKQ
jgi:hypothetical protein